MDSKTIILMGKCGAGKGTQAKLLCDHLAKTGKVIYLETGSSFRSYIKEKSFSSLLSREIMNAGERQPEFLAVLMWGNLLLKNIITGNEHIVIDGAPRALSEAVVLDTAFSFYKRNKPNVILLGIHDDTVLQRLLKRGREDDNPKDIATRLSWFKKDVVPAIEFFKENTKNYNYKIIDANRPPEEVHSLIIQTLA